MFKPLITILFLAIVAVAVLVYARTNVSTRARPVLGSAVAASERTESGQIRASKLLGSTVYNGRDGKIGVVKELILAADGTIAAVVVEVTFVGFDHKYVAVDMSDIFGNGDHLRLDRTSDQLQQMASYKFDNNDIGAGASSPESGRRPIAVPPR